MKKAGLDSKEVTMFQNKGLIIEKFIKPRMPEQTAAGTIPSMKVQDAQDLLFRQEKKAACQNSNKNQLSQVEAFFAIVNQILLDNPIFQSIEKKEHLRDEGLERNFLEILLEKVVQGYEESSSAVCRLRGNYTPQLQIILQLFPSFFFSMATQLRIAGKHHALSKELQIVGIIYLTSSGCPGQNVIQFFLDDIQSKADTTLLHERHVSQAKRAASYSQTICEELYLFGKYFSLNKTTSKRELIENQYIVQGVFNILLKYYFDLLALAVNDTIAEYINVIFSNLFIYIRNKAKKYWSDLANADIIQVQLQHIVEQNNPPYFFRNRFDLLKTYHPLLYPEENEKSKLLEKQLESFESFSLKKLVLFVHVVCLCQGEKYASSLLFHLHQFKEAQFFQLEHYLEQNQSQRNYNALLRLTQRLPIIRKITPTKPKAPRLQLDNPNIDPDIRCWGQYLKNFYRSVLKAWDVSEEEIPVFFKQFAEESLLLLREKQVTQQTSMRFKRALDQLVQQFLKRVSLHQQEIQIYQKQINEELINIETVDFEERRQKIDNIGGVLIDAKQKEQQYEQLYKEALPIQLVVNYNNQRHTFSIEEVLLLPLPNRQKERLLETYVPRMISDQMMRALYNLKLSRSAIAENHTSIYDMGKYPKLKTGKLLQLLETSRGFEALIEREIIPIMFNNHIIKITVRNFFTFPLFPKNSQSGEEWTAQHMQYLKLQMDNNEFPVSAYEIIVNNLYRFPRREYSERSCINH